MSDEKISQLDAVTDVLDDDDYVLARAGASKRITGASLKADLGGSSSFGSQYLQVVGNATMNGTASTSPGLFFDLADFSIFTPEKRKGTDLTFAESVHHPGQVAFFTAAGGSFTVQTLFGMTMTTTDAGVTVARFVDYYTNSSGGSNPQNLGSDCLVPLIPDVQVDHSTYSMPYFDIAAGGEFCTNPSFAGAQGSDDDVVDVQIILTAWLN